MSILIQNVLVDGRRTDILVKKGLIKKIDETISDRADSVIDGSGKAAVPAFVNAHTHSAMTLLRGYADDLPLKEWLEKKIWPFEKGLSEEDVYWATRLACIEMIRSGTTHFNDMYWFYKGTARATVDAGLHANLSSAFIDLGDEHVSRQQIREQEELFAQRAEFEPHITFTLAVHALYTVSESGLFWARDFAKDNGLRIHMHLSETEQEVAEWVEQTGMRPIEYLNSVNMLGPHLIAAHMNWVNDREVELLADNDVGVVHCPASNMKLASGIFPYTRLKNAGVRIGLASDGAASNNNVDMLDEMKIAALLQKSSSRDPTVMPAEEVFQLATSGGASLFDLNMGRVESGMSADLLLIDLQSIQLVPNHNLIANLVYSAHSGCIDTTISCGKILMQNGIVEGEEEVISEFRRRVDNLAAS